MTALKRLAVFIGLPIAAYYLGKLLAWFFTIIDIGFWQMFAAAFAAFIAAGLINVYRVWRGSSAHQRHGSRSDPPRQIGPRWIERGE